MLDIRDTIIIDLISSIYDAADESSSDGWKNVYQRIAKLTNTRRGSLNLYVEKLGEYGPVAGNFPDDFHRVYNEYFHSVNPFKNVVGRMKSGQRFNRQEAMSDEQFRKTEIYNDYHRKFDTFHFEHQVFLIENGLACGLTLTRSEKEGNFSTGELHVLKYLVPHLQRAFRLYLSISAIRRQNVMLAEAIDRIPRGVLAVDADRNIIFANQAAVEMLRQTESGLVSRRARLSSSVSESNRELKRVIKTVFDPAAALSNKAGLVHLERASGTRPLQLFVAPISERHFRFDGGENLALVFITDPDQTSEGASQVLKGLYGLTLSEVRVATMIADGKTLLEASEMLGVSMNTVRTHLKHIFSKTGTKRQGELMKLITVGPASLRNFD